MFGAIDVSSVTSTGTDIVTALGTVGVAGAGVAVAGIGVLLAWKFIKRLKGAV